jgi:hypothetical protein
MQEFIESGVKLTGAVKIDRFNSVGELVETLDIKNLVVTAGKNFIASRMAGTSAAVMSHMAVGTSGTAAAVGDTGLGAQVGITTLTGSTASTNTVTYTATFAAGTGTGALVEAGIFNASSSGTLLCRTVFPVVNKAAGDVISVTWVVTVS